MGVKKDRRATVAPLSPVGQTGKSGASRLDESVAIDLVESVLKVNLKKGEVRAGVAFQYVSERVRDDLNSSRTPYSVVSTLKHLSDADFSSDAKTLRNQPTKWIPTAQGSDRHASPGLTQGDRNPSC
jgi:hypothetical protein